MNLGKKLYRPCFISLFDLIIYYILIITINILIRRNLNSTSSTKSVFPLEMIEYFGAFVLGILIALSNAGGVGGGGVVVPICIVFFGFSPKQSVALSNFCIFSAAITRFLMNIKQKHPYKKATNIDYSLAMVMFPMILLGTMVGVKINTMLPDLILIIGLTLLLVFLSVHSMFTAIKIRRKEIHDKQVCKY